MWNIFDMGWKALSVLWNYVKDTTQKQTIQAKILLENSKPEELNSIFCDCELSICIFRQPQDTSVEYIDLI